MNKTEIVTQLIVVIVVVFILMFLWNWLMPTIFGIQTINYLQALGLYVLSSILFKFHSTVK